MADFLRGISAGVERGLADLVTSKRAERTAKRDQRRYENALVLQLGQVKSERDYRNKMFAYQKSRDDKRDAEWAQKMGLERDIFEADKKYKAETLAATIAAEDAANEDRDLLRQQQQSQFEATQKQDQEQFDKNLAQRIREQTDASERWRQTLLETVRQGNAQLEFDKTKQLHTMRKDNFAAELARNEFAATNTYRNRLLDFEEAGAAQKSRLTESQIQENLARAGYYNRQGTSSSEGITFSQRRTVADDYASTFGKALLEHFTDQGVKWATPFVERQVGEGPIMGRIGWPKIDQVLPWQNPGDPNADTQEKRMRAIGADAFRGLVQEIGDVQATIELMPGYFTKMIENNPELYDHFVDYLMHSPMNNPKTGQPYTEIEMLGKARQAFIEGARAAPATMIQEAEDARKAGTKNDPMLDRDPSNPDRKAVPDKGKNSFWSIF